MFSMTTCMTLYLIFLLTLQCSTETVAAVTGVAINSQIPLSSVGDNIEDATNTNVEEGIKGGTQLGSDSKRSHNQNLKEPGTSIGNLITLDLAGRFDVHLSSPSVNVVTEYDNNNKIEEQNVQEFENDNVPPYATKPLFRWGQTTVNRRVHRIGNRNPNNIRQIKRGIQNTVPTIHLGPSYDFKKVWHGFTSVRTRFSWNTISMNHQKSNPQPRKQRQNQISKVLTLEKGLLSPTDHAMDFSLAFPSNRNIDSRNENNRRINHEAQKIQFKQKPTSVSVRYEVKDHDDINASISANTSLLHPRFHLMVKSIMKLKSDNGSVFPKFTRSSLPTLPSLSASPFISKIEQKNFNWSDETSWIPDVKMTPAGAVISNSSFGLNSKKHDCNRVGLRFMVRKQINWNLLGSVFQLGSDRNTNGMQVSSSFDDDYHMNDTMLRVEVCGLTGVHSYTSISAEASLERFAQTFHCTLSQEGIINS